MDALLTITAPRHRLNIMPQNYKRLSRLNGRLKDLINKQKLRKVQSELNQKINPIDNKDKIMRMVNSSPTSLKRGKDVLLEQKRTKETPLAGHLALIMPIGSTNDKI